MIDWEGTARRLGHQSARSMFYDLAVKHDLGSVELSQRFRVSATSIIAAMRSRGIAVRERGSAGRAERAARKRMEGRK